MHAHDTSKVCSDTLCLLPCDVVCYCYQGNNRVIRLQLWQYCVPTYFNTTRNCCRMYDNPAMDCRELKRRKKTKAPHRKANNTEYEQTLTHTNLNFHHNIHLYTYTPQL